MTFDDIMQSASIGEVISVRDGSPEPRTGTRAHLTWRARNYTGELIEKRQENIRALLVQDLNVEPPVKSRVHIASEGDGLTFDLPQSLVAQKSVALSRLAARRWGAQSVMAYDGVSPISYGADTAGNIIATLTALNAQDVLDPGGAPHTVTWKLCRSEFRTWTAAQLQAFGFSVLAYMAACFTCEGELSAAIDAAEDIEALNTINLDAGWPVTGGGE